MFIFLDPPLSMMVKKWVLLFHERLRFLAPVKVYSWMFGGKSLFSSCKNENEPLKIIDTNLHYTKQDKIEKKFISLFPQSTLDIWFVFV